MRRLLTLLIAASALAAACGDDGGDRDTGAAATDGSGETWITDLLALVPDDGANGAQVIANDYVLARAGSGVELPDDAASDDEIANYRIEMTAEVPGPGTAPPMAAGLQGLGDSTDEVGFTFEDIDRDIAAGVTPDTIEFLQGAFDPGEVEQAVTSDQTWSDALERAEAGGTEYYSWLDDGEIDVERRSTLRPVGGSLRLAVTEDGAVVSRSTAEMEAVLEGSGPTLADRTEHLAVAKALQDEGAHSVFLTDTSRSGFAAGTADLLESDDPAALADELLSGGVGFDRPAVLGTGGGYRDGAPVFVEVLAYGDDKTAQANADRLATLVDEGESLVSQTPWSELLTVESVEVRDGLVVAVFTTERPTVWLDVVLQSDNLVTVG